MPLEIRQIGIRLRVSDTPPVEDRDPPRVAFDDEAHARIVQDCTRAVLASLARNARR